MSTGESELGLQKILDFTRLSAIFILLLHFYYYCYGLFKQLHWTMKITDNLLKNISHSGLFNHFDTSKHIALGMLMISLLGAKGKKNEKIIPKNISIYNLFGLTCYYAANLVFQFGEDVNNLAIAYIAIASFGFILILTGGTLLSRLIKLKLKQYIFN